MNAKDLARRIVKVIAALCAVSVLLLSVFGFLIWTAMGEHPLGPNWSTALIVLPVFAVTGFIWATLNENRKRTASIMTYIAVAVTPIAWVALTRP